MGAHPELAKQRAPGGSVYRALARDTRLRGVIDSARRDDGNYEFGSQLAVSFERVMRKTVQGLFFGLYERFVSASEVSPLFLVDQRLMSADAVVDWVRPSPLRDITDEPASGNNSVQLARSWARFSALLWAPRTAISSVERLFRLVRDAPAQLGGIPAGYFSLCTREKRRRARGMCIRPVEDSCRNGSGSLARQTRAATPGQEESNVS